MIRFFHTATAVSLFAFSAYAQSQKAPEGPKTPAQNFAEFIRTHSDTTSFVSGLETLFRDRFANLKEPTAMFQLCQQLGTTGTFGLPHPALQALGAKCQDNNPKEIRAELLKFSENTLTQEFAAAVQEHLKARGSINAFAQDLSHTLHGNEKPLLAFGIFVIFAT